MSRSERWAPGTPDRIHDVVIHPIEAKADRTPILRRDDHLLRRFGAAEILRLRPGETFSCLRRIADEVWAVLEGEGTLRLEDCRTDSPTTGLSETHRLPASTRILVPFGVRAEIHADGPSLTICRLMTHDLTEDPPASTNGGSVG